YLFRVGALDWAPEARRKRQAKLKQGGFGNAIQSHQDRPRCS
ncbi:hypothetical protein ACIOU6_27890, partial [Pseudomonas sp. NPDC087615]